LWISIVSTDNKNGEGRLIREDSTVPLGGEAVPLPLPQLSSRDPAFFTVRSPPDFNLFVFYLWAQSISSYALLIKRHMSEV
jgi:hypothetical protein